MRNCPVVALMVALAAVAALTVSTVSAQTRNDGISLPETNMSVEPPSRELLRQVAAGFSRATIAHNPLAPNATSVGSAVCSACHTLETEHFAHTIHAVGLRVAEAADSRAAVCETCHGAGSAHAERPTEAGLIIAFTNGGATPIDVQTGTCLNCHAGGPRNHWLGSVHERFDLSCADCHNPMADFSAEGLMARQSISETCATCHRDIRMQFNRRSHMPLPEGQMTCADCHNPHGSLAPALLKTDTVNETCYQCHAEKRGPFLFEHAPVRDDCTNCHLPHGSNQHALLVAPIPFLCQQCHSHTRHPNDLLTAQSLGPGMNPDERLLGRGCISCHAQVHGSNHPSGSRFHR